jgi:hypothetical protein
VILRDDIGLELLGIQCKALGGIDVVTHNEAGEQVMGRLGMATTVDPNIVSGAPENCPLTLESAGRELANFAVCKQCPHATILEDTEWMEVWA